MVITSVNPHIFIPHLATLKLYRTIRNSDVPTATHPPSHFECDCCLSIFTSCWNTDSGIAYCVRKEHRVFFHNLWMFHNLNHKCITLESSLQSHHHLNHILLCCSFLMVFGCFKLLEMSGVRFSTGSTQGVWVTSTLFTRLSNKTC